MAFYLGDTLTSSQQVRAFDQITYDRLAQSLLAGRGFSFTTDYYPGFTPAGTPTAHWSFLYPIYLAGVYTLTGDHPLAVRMFQAVVVGILETWLVFQLGKALFNSKTGLVAAGLSAGYAYFIYYDAALMTEPFFISSILAVILLGLHITGLAKVQTSSESRPGKEDQAGTTNRLGMWAVLGVIFGISALLRQTILLWMPFQIAWMLWAPPGKGALEKPAWKQRLPGALLSIVLAAFFVLPWTMRNYVVYGHFLPLNSNAGYAIYSANHPDHGIHFDQDYAAPLPDDLLLKDLNEAEWNQALTSLGIGFILQDPTRYLMLTASKFAVHFNFWFSRESSLFSNLMRVFSFGLYLPLFIMGLAISWKERQRCSLVYLFLIIFNLLHILTWSGTRYRLPVDAVLMPFAGLAVYTVANEIMKRRKTEDRIRGKEDGGPVNEDGGKEDGGPVTEDGRIEVG